MWLFAVVMGVMFGLPHVVRIATLGSYAAYSPFTAHSRSAMVFDETFLYAAEANHLLTWKSMAYDDTWEHRAAVYPYSVVPTAIEAVLAVVVRSLKLAHILLGFVFPALTAVLLMVMFRRAGAGLWLAALLAMFVLVGAFSPVTWKMDVLAFFNHGQGARVFDALQAARMPNPAMTFVQFAAALLLLADARLGTGSQRRVTMCAIGAGLLGGLLYFSYIYYAITWSLLVGVLAVISLVRRRAIARRDWLPLAITVVFAAMFMAWKHVSVVQGNYEMRAMRIGLYHSHAFEPTGLVETWIWGGQALVCAGIWLWLRRGRSADVLCGTRWRYVDALMPVLLAGMASGLAGMNMQVVTGFNLQQVQHYPHMILQPLGFMMLGLLVALVYPRGRAWEITAAASLVFVLALSAMAQVEVGRDTAAQHESPLEERALFAWLKENSAVGSVVATDDLALSIVLPVQTHNSVLFANGSRSSAPDVELMERFLLASHLAGTPPVVVERELIEPTAPDEDVTVANYPLYLFEFSRRYQRIPAERRLAPDRLAGVMQWYGVMDVAQQLGRFRVDYVWMRGSAVPADVAGWRFERVLATGEGSLWQLTRS
jgi:hypothetical protein